MANIIRSGAMMRFAHRPQINWMPQSPKARRNWCGLCRQDAGPLFDVPDNVWLHYVGHDQRHRIVCLGCWRWLVSVIDDGAYQAQHGGPVALWSDVWRQRHGIALRRPGAVHCTLLPACRQTITIGLALGCRVCDRTLVTENDVFEIDLDIPGKGTLGPVCRTCGETAEGKPFSQWLDEQHRPRELCMENRAAAAAAAVS